MKSRIGIPTILALSLVSMQAQGQAWDPVKKATGWARVDKDGSIAFYDSASRKIYSWMRDGGIIGEVDVSKLEQPPEKWVVGFNSNAWVVSGRNLYHVLKNGTVFATKLPYEVGDLAWDTDNFYISYKCQEPYIEMRGYDSGSVIWYLNKKKTPKEEAAPQVLHRILVNENDSLLCGSRDSLQLETVNVTNGRSMGQTALTFGGAPAPTLTIQGTERGPMAWWLNKNTVVSVVPASQVPSLRKVGLLLAVENLAKATVEFQVTGLSEQHNFIGMIESEAIFIAPGGGLVNIPVR